MELYDNDKKRSVIITKIKILLIVKYINIIIDQKNHQNMEKEKHNKWWKEKMDK